MSKLAVQFLYHRISDPAIENPLALALGTGQFAVAHHHHLRRDHEPVLDDVTPWAARWLIKLLLQIPINLAPVLNSDNKHYPVIFLDFINDPPVSDPGISLSFDHFQLFRQSRVERIDSQLSYSVSYSWRDGAV